MNIENKVHYLNEFGIIREKDLVPGETVKMEHWHARVDTVDDRKIYEYPDLSGMSVKEIASGQCCQFWRTTIMRENLINFGASPRGSINLAKASKCFAFIKRRGYVIPEDVRAVVLDVLRHRIGLTYEAEAENITSEDIINKIVNKVEVP